MNDEEDSDHSVDTLVGMRGRIIGGIGLFLMGMGIVVFLFAGYQLWGTNLEEQNRQQDLAEETATALGIETNAGSSDQVAEQVIEKLASIDPKTVPPSPAPPEGSAGGYIEIPKIGVLKAFVEGVTKADLRKGPGHYVGTPLPGQAGNVGIAGHRTTYGAPFNRIDELVPGDVINFYTAQGKFRYEVLPAPEGRGISRGAAWYTVEPENVEVLDPTGENIVTLTACHPKRSAAQRIIVHAKLATEPVEAVPTTTTVPVSSNDDSSTVEEEPDEQAALFAGDPGELTPTVLWGSAFFGIWGVAAGLATWLRSRHRPRWFIHIILLAPAGLALWNCFFHLDKYLPSF